jgi:transposase
MMADRGTGVRFRQFLEHLVRRWPTDQLVLVLDNAAYHKTAAVRAWLAAHADQVTVCWLPAYSPHLNRIERVWRFLKSKLACHRFWNDLPGLIHAANHLLHRIAAQYTDPDRPRLSMGQNLEIAPIGNGGHGHGELHHEGRFAAIPHEGATPCPPCHHGSSTPSGTSARS